MDGSQVANKIEKTVFAWGNLPLKLLVCSSGAIALSIRPMTSFHELSAVITKSSSVVALACFLSWDSSWMFPEQKDAIDFRADFPCYLGLTPGKTTQVPPPGRSIVVFSQPVVLLTTQS